MLLRLPIAVLIISLSLPAPASDSDSKISGLIDRAQSAPLAQLPKLCTDIAEYELKQADELYSSGEVEKARALVADVIIYSDKASNAAIDSGKRLKDTEISMRKMSLKLRDMKRTLTFSDQPPLQDASDHLETLRSELLEHMFKKKK